MRYWCYSAEGSRLFSGVTRRARRTRPGRRTRAFSPSSLEVGPPSSPPSATSPLFLAFLKIGPVVFGSGYVIR